MTDAPSKDLKRTPLHGLHMALGARLVPFAGYEMPVQYEGIIAEHLHARGKAVLFDVSHMGQARLIGDDPGHAIEELVPGAIHDLPEGKMRYTLLLNERGGIIDDLMVTQRGDHLFLVVNAACKDGDFLHISERLAGKAALVRLEDRALLALQGPAAAEVMARLAPDSASMGFMTARNLEVGGIDCDVTRSGYTGEDGFEISVAESDAEALARKLLAEDEVKPAGLGARDSLRLEAGLCLYGSDIDETTTPVEAGLTWTVNKRRREEANFPGATIILRQIKEGTTRKRVGIKPEGKAPARAHTEIVDADGSSVGEITSGGYGPSVGGPVAMGYVAPALATPGTALNLVVRQRDLPATVVKLPFTEHRYFKG
ncbi:MAG: glycine cleavage system aminomethyltransferase GcvT [Rhodospirillales bacterium]|nr:glycine cleavage system aminomethyltransferase GcvT [Rhodospirillales bacterium]